MMKRSTSAFSTGRALPQLISREYRGESKNGVFPRYSELYTNFVKVDNQMKIHVLDTIIDHASDVFGPLSGQYGELEGTYLRPGDRVKIEAANYLKSSDGHNFFNRMEFGTLYASTIMKAIQQQTKYISGYDGQTSRDGTTSLAIVGCNIAKAALIYRETSHNYPLIKNVLRDAIEVVTYVGTKLIKDNAIKVYDEKKCSYTNDDMFRHAANTINTTVGGETVFTDAFERLMKDCEERTLDITSCYAQAPTRLAGDKAVELKVTTGVKMRVSSLNADLAMGFRDNYGPLFILDGFIDREYRDFYVKAFLSWIKGICMTIDQETKTYKYSRYNPNYRGVPVLLVTRVPDYLEPVYHELASKGIEVTYNLNGQVTKEHIKPIIMNAHDTEFTQLYYDDATEVFWETVVNLNLMNRYMKTYTENVNVEITEKGGIRQKTPKKPIDELFPKLIDNMYTVEVPIQDDENEVWDNAPNVVNNIKYSNTKTIVFGEGMIYLGSGYDGQSFLITPEDMALVERIRLKRKSLTDLQESYSQMAVELNNLNERLNFFSGISIMPILYCRTDDEWYDMLNIYEDALGVFTSIHVHGILPGANTFLMRAYNEFNKQVDELWKQQKAYKSKIGEDVINLILNSIYDGYIESLNILYGENAENIVDTLMHMGINSTDVLNINTGIYESCIFEAARTTSDVFVGSLSIMLDMLQLRRVRVDRYEEWKEASTRHENPALHPRNKKYWEDGLGDGE